MPFDLSTATPVSAGFDLSTAQPVTDSAISSSGPGEPRRGRYVTNQERSARNFAAWQKLPLLSRMALDPDAMDPGGIEARNNATADAGRILTGIPENVVSGVTGGVGSLADAVTGSDPGTHDFAYRPRTEGGRRVAELSAGMARLAGSGYDNAFGTGPLATTLKERGAEALGAVGTVTGAAGLARVGIPRLMPTRAPVLTAEETLSQQAGTAGSQGAAAAVPDLTRASPELRQAVVNAGQKGGVNMDAAQRQARAESLPVPIRLMRGQANRDPVHYSNEQNMRGARPEIAKRIGDQNQQLVENLQAIREQVGPDVFTTNAVEHADSLIQSYRKLDKDLSTDISAKYKALADANGGTLPIDGEQFLKQASQNLQRENKGRFLPPEIKRTLADIGKSTRKVMDPTTMAIERKSGMTFGQFENLRTSLAAAIRQAERAGNGNAVGAIAQVRNALENMPLPPEAANLKPLADAARNASRSRFEMLEKDPAYKAAINKSVRPDLFVRRFVTGGDARKLEIMRRNLANDPVAAQTMAVAAFDHLREGARISPDWTGKFTQAGFGKVLQQLDPKARHLFTPDVRETLGNMRDVANDLIHQPAGSFVNNSNTLVAGAANAAAGSAEGMANLAAGGVPVGTWARKGINKLTTGREVKRILEPGAGVRK